MMVRIEPKSMETKCNVGDIIYPHYNGTNGFLKKPRWDLVYEVDNEGYPKGILYIWDYSTVKAIEVMQQIYKLEPKGGN
jgi:hypothetical protein